MFSRFIHVEACVRISKSEYSIVYIDHFLFIHCSDHGHLSCFYPLAIINNTVVIFHDPQLTPGEGSDFGEGTGSLTAVTMMVRRPGLEGSLPIPSFSCFSVCCPQASLQSSSIQLKYICIYFFSSVHFLWVCQSCNLPMTPSRLDFDPFPMYLKKPQFPRLPEDAVSQRTVVEGLSLKATGQEKTEGSGKCVWNLVGLPSTEPWFCLSWQRSLILN